MANRARARSTWAAGALSERLRRVSSWRSSAVSGRRGSFRWRDMGHLGARGSPHHYTSSHGRRPTIEAVFVAVPSADLAIGRVAQRTAAGGLFVPPEDVRRRYERSFDNLPGLVARADVTTVYDNTEKNRTVVARVEGGDFTLRRLDATNDLHVRIAQAIKAGLSDRTDPARPIARQTHGRARAPSRNDAIASARGDASETLAPEVPRTAPPDVLALVTALTQAAHALNGALQGAQQGQGRPARQQTDGPERRSEAWPTRALLPSRQLDRTLPAEEVCKRAASDPRLGKYRAAVQAAAEMAFKEPGPIVEALSRQAIEKPETIAEARRQLYEKPQDLGDLRGGTTRYLRREDEERQAARSAAQWVALGLTDLAGAAQSIKAEIVGEWALVRNSGGGRRAVVGRAFRRCAATPAYRAGSSGSAPRSRPGLPFSEQAESGREDH